jgi:hypothetical protein
LYWLIGVQQDVAVVAATEATRIRLNRARRIVLLRQVAIGLGQAVLAKLDAIEEGLLPHVAHTISRVYRGHMHERRAVHFVVRKVRTRAHGIDDVDL